MHASTRVNTKRFCNRFGHAIRRVNLPTQLKSAPIGAKNATFNNLMYFFCFYVVFVSLVNFSLIRRRHDFRRRTANLGRWRPLRSEGPLSCYTYCHGPVVFMVKCRNFYSENRYIWLITELYRHKNNRFHLCSIK